MIAWMRKKLNAYRLWRCRAWIAAYEAEERK